MLCVIAKLDDASTSKLNSLKNKVNAAAGLSGKLYGHITIAAYVGNEDAGFIEYCKEKMKAVSAFQVMYERVEVLDKSSIIVAAPEKNAALKCLHDQINERYSSSLDEWTNGDAWHPHTTLLYSPNADLNRICRLVSQEFIPFSAFVHRIEFSRVLKNGYEIIDGVDLADPSVMLCRFRYNKALFANKRIDHYER